MTFGKIIGAGMPVGAYGGRRAVMEMVSPLGPVYQAGTLSGNPVAMAAGLAQLTLLRQHPGWYETLNETAGRFFGEIQSILSSHGRPYPVNHLGSLGCIFFTQGPVTNHPEAKTVFIGPCIAKKREADQSASVDACLTFEELIAWMAEEGVAPVRHHGAVDKKPASRRYPTTGGILSTLDKDIDCTRIAVDGMLNIRAVLDELRDDASEHVFIEMSACEGSCINGPVMREHKKKRMLGAMKVENYAGDDLFGVEAPNDLRERYAPDGLKRVMPGNEAIQEVLNRMGKTTPDNLDLKRARRVLEENHYGLEKVKERIIEYLAVLRMKNDMKGPILCFAGPPGVGKTSIVRAIAKAVGRQFVQMSLGGVRDEAEIRGHRRTYVGAIPGRIIAGIKQAGTMNPVFLFDEIDKMSSDFRGDPAAAMLEVLDAEQNSAFRDHYMEIPFDLSRVMFITTANNMENIPPALLDRLEIIEVPSYTEEEKLKIARKHLLPKQIEAHGLKPRSVRMNDRVLRTVIEGYTREAGVRELERTLARVARKAAVEMLEQKTEEITVTQDKLTAYLGQPRYTREPLEKENRVGVVNGLAYTSVGGEMLSVECAVLKGTGALQLTGKLGDVMQESAKAALSWVRAHCDPWGVPADFFKQNDIHIHVPEGAVPKDGPSAGVTLVTALVSALTSIPVRQNVAMTGEITLRGRVLPIGGLKEKLMAAYRAGVRTVLIPRENLKDLEDVSPTVRERIDIRPVDDVAEVIRAALVCEPPVIADTPLELPLTAPQPAKPGMYKGV